MKLIFPVFLLVSSMCICQTVPIDFTLIDSSVKKVPSGVPGILAQNLTAPYETDIEKVRSIFKWITENIAYDTKGYYNLNDIYKGLYQPLDSLDSATVYKNYNDNIVKKVLREKVAICDGYTRLFKTLCDYAKIKAEIVTGYVRWYSDSIGEQTKRIHAWNAVEIDGKWHLLDPTWASGFSNTDVTAFKKEYDDYYFLTPPDDLLNDHFPLDSKWLLLPHSITIKAFYNQPYLFSAFRKFKIKSYKPVTGVIETMVGDKILFELEADEPEKQMAVLASLRADSRDLLKPKNTVTGNKVAYLYDITSGETKELNVIYKGELAMRYRVRFKK